MTIALSVNSIRSMQRERRKAADAAQWRLGFLAALDRRLFLSIAPAQPDAEVDTNCDESQPFAEGFDYGMNCPLAVTIPEQMAGEYMDGDQYKTAAIICGATLCLAIGALYIASTGAL